MYDLIKLLKTYKPHHLVATNHDDTLSVLNQLSNIFNANTQSNLPSNCSVTKPYIAKLLRVPTLNSTLSPRMNKYLQPTINTNSYISNHKNIHNNSSTHQQYAYYYNTQSKSICNIIATTRKLNGSNAILNEDTSKLEEYRQLKTGKDKVLWHKSFSNELGQLVQGIHDIKGTNCIFFIPYNQIPKGKKIAYARIMCTIRSQKKETH